MVERGDGERMRERGKRKTGNGYGRGEEGKRTREVSEGTERARTGDRERGDEERVRAV